MGRLSGRAALVTGAGRGIGRSIALEFAREGAKVSVSSRTKNQLDCVVDEIQNLGSEGTAIVCDVLDREAIKKTVASVIDRFGRLHVLVNNAGGVYYDKLEDILSLTSDDKLF